MGVKKIFKSVLLLMTSVLVVSLVYDLGKNPLQVFNALFPWLSVLLMVLINFKLMRVLGANQTLSVIKKMMFAVAFVISVVMSCFTVSVAYVDQQLQSRSYTDAYKDCFKIWAARGLVLEGPDILHTGNQNSIESIGRAFERGARGTEVDIHYDAEMEKFIVAHDKPYNLKNGALLTLESLFQATAGSSYYWLDLKKVRRLNDQELTQSVIELERIAQLTNLKSKIYVEGEAPFSLAAFRDAGFKTIFDTHPLPDSNPLTPPIINLYKLFYYFGDFTVMAMNYGAIDDPFYGARTRQLLGDIPMFLYHVDDVPELLMMLSGLDTVRVILVLDHSRDRYSVNACGIDK